MTDPRYLGCLNLPTGHARIFEPHGLIPLSEADNSDKDGFCHTRPFGNALLVLVERHLAIH